MSAVPALIPVTTPVLVPMLISEATVLHVPPVGISLRLVVAPGHVVRLPEIADGSIDTLTVAVLVQPSGNV